MIDAGLVPRGLHAGGVRRLGLHRRRIDRGARAADVEPFGLYGMELTHKHVPEMKKYWGERAPVRAVGRPLCPGHAGRRADHRDITLGRSKPRTCSGCWRSTMPARNSSRCGRSPTAAGWSATASARRPADRHQLDGARGPPARPSSRSSPSPRSTTRQGRIRRGSATINSRPASTGPPASPSPSRRTPGYGARRRRVPLPCGRARRLQWVPLIGRGKPMQADHVRAVSRRSALNGALAGLIRDDDRPDHC